jgi:hypothetical protein
MIITLRETRAQRYAWFRLLTSTTPIVYNKDNAVNPTVHPPLICALVIMRRENPNAYIGVRYLGVVAFKPQPCVAPLARFTNSATFPASAVELEMELTGIEMSHSPSVSAEDLASA